MTSIMDWKKIMTEFKSQTLAKFCVESTYESLPKEIAEKTLVHIVDSIAAGVAGAISAEAAILRKTLPERALTDVLAGVWGTERKLWAPDAALINGTASHAFELDDTGGCDHSGAVVLPAAIAACEISDVPVTGKDFIAAVAIGYDVARRPLEACGAYEPHNKAGFHSTGTCGPFGAAAAAAKILKLDEHQTQMALGIASSFSAGLWACVHDGAMNKRLHAGHAAYGGVLSALLAKNGFTGPEQIFEEVWGGFNHSFAPTSSVPEAYTRELGTNWRIRRVSIKPHASCRSTHSVIDAYDALRAKYGFKKEEIKELIVTINPFVYGMCGHKATAPMTRAQLSIPYSLSADIIYGDASLASFSAKCRENPEIVSMMDKIRFVIDKSQADDEEPTLDVVLCDGKTLREHVAIPLGDPRNPVSEEGLKKKFFSSVSMVLPEENTEALYKALKRLPDALDFKKEIAPLLGSDKANLKLFADR